MRTDAELVRAYGISGDEEAFSEIARRHGPAVLRACVRMLNDAHAAQDATQAVFLVLARKAGSLRQGARLAAWLHGVARHVSLRVLRGRAVRARREEEAAMRRHTEVRRGATGAEREAALARLDRALLSLSPGQREAVMLRHLEGRSEKEAAAIAGVPVGTLSRRASDGLAKLRRKLAKRGAALGLAPLGALLASEAQATAPSTLLPSILAVSKLAATGAVAGGAGESHVVVALAKGAMKMMFWAKVKVAACVLAAAAVVGTGAGVALSGARAGELAAREEKDSSGKEWVLTEWKEGARPYPKDLKEREAWYREKWGEYWAGKPYPGYRTKGPYTCSPGTWTCEEFAVIPGGKKASPGLKGGVWRWQKSQTLVFAPGGGEEVTAVYAVTDFGMYHVDPATKAVTYAGVIPKYTLKPTNRKNANGQIWHNLVFDPAPEIIKDGLDGEARLRPARTQSGGYLSVDPVTGRVYFHQATQPSTRPRRRPEDMQGPYALRYVEKLLPYEENGREVLLPALLDYQDMYKKVRGPNGGELKPVMKDGRRGAVRLAVRTTPVKYAAPFLPGHRGWGKKMLLSPDGKAVYADVECPHPPAFNKLREVEIETGRDLGEIKKPANFPAGPGGHGGTCSRFDGSIYSLVHPGCGGGPGTLFSFDVKTGRLVILYDSHAAWPALRDGRPKDEVKKQFAAFEASRAAAGTVDGPADAVSLRFVTTCYQSQCPRTGAIYNGGWDQSGIRRYHDGFVTTLANGGHSNSALKTGGRPEWDSQTTASWGNLQSAPDVAPNGDVYLTDSSQPNDFPGRKDVEDGIRIVKLHRTDWPKEQPVNGYANRFLSPEKREEMMLEYCKNYIANYAELSKIY